MKPLTKQQISKIHETIQPIVFEKWKAGISTTFTQEFARAIEKAHGIK